MGAPIGICIVIASFSTMMLVLPSSMFATAQKMFSASTVLPLLAVPFFVCPGDHEYGECPAGQFLPNCLPGNRSGFALLYQHRRQYDVR